jgi:hypothetical protein
MLSDPEAAKKLTHMLTRCMGEEETTIAISAPLPRMGCVPGEQTKAHRKRVQDDKLNSEAMRWTCHVGLGI